MTATPAPIAQDVLERIRAVTGDAGVLTAAADKAPYLTDERGYYTGATPMVVRPATVEEVSAVVKICSETGTAIVPQGGNTGLCGAATPHEHGGEILLSLTRMNRVREVDPLNYTITVEAGVILADVQRAAEEADRLFPLSLGGEGTARIGGNLSTNAGGTGVLRYGPARDLCLGLEAVMPNGDVWNGLTGLRKDNTGYDLKHLLIGAEGTLGIITAACLKLFPRPADIRNAFLAVRDEHAAVELLARARRTTDDRVVTFEYMSRQALDFVFRHFNDLRDPLPERHDHYVMMEIASGEASAANLRDLLEGILTDGFAAGLVLDAVIAESGRQAADSGRSAKSFQRRRGIRARASSTTSRCRSPGSRTSLSRRSRRSTAWSPTCAPAPSAMSATATSTSISALPKGWPMPSSWRPGRKSTGWSTTAPSRWAARSAPSTASDGCGATSSGPTSPRWRSMRCAP